MRNDDAASGSISVEQLRTLRAVASERTFTRAAETLFITQPAVTHRLRRLEEALGVALFRRTDGGRELELSTAGERALRFADDVSRLLVDFRADLAALQLSDTDQVVTIASGESLLLPYLITAFQQRHPHVEVRVVYCATAEVDAAVAAGTCDLGFEFSSDPDERFYHVPILDDRVVVVTCGDEQVPSDPAENLRGMRETPVLLSNAGKFSRQVMDEWSEAQHLHLRVALESHSYGVLLKAVSHRFGITAVPERLVGRRLASGELRTVPLPGFPRDFVISLIADMNRPLSDAARAFLQLVREPAWRAALPPEYASVAYVTAG
jgi:DNA-binding transcriptional LysR family regulator